MVAKNTVRRCGVIGHCKGICSLDFKYPLRGLQFLPWLVNKMVFISRLRSYTLYFNFFAFLSSSTGINKCLEGIKSAIKLRYMYIVHYIGPRPLMSNQLLRDISLLDVVSDINKFPDLTINRKMGSGSEIRKLQLSNVFIVENVEKKSQEIRYFCSFNFGQKNFKKKKHQSCNRFSYTFVYVSLDRIRI